MKWIVIVLSLLITGCYEVEKKENLTESAIVRDLVYSPSQHGSGPGIGMSMSGNMVMVVNSINIRKKYAVVFEWQHGKLIVEGGEKKHKELWERLTVGQRVQVTYNELWRVNNDGSRKLMERTFVDAR